jgi:hypothetical protein
LISIPHIEPNAVPRKLASKDSRKVALKVAFLRSMALTAAGVVSAGERHKRLLLDGGANGGRRRGFNRVLVVADENKSVAVRTENGINLRESGH